MESEWVEKQRYNRQRRLNRMAWTKRKVEGEIVMLGDKAKERREVGGLLAAIKQTTRHKHVYLYELVQKDGTSLLVYGCTDIKRQINSKDIGRFVKMEFKEYMDTGKGNPAKIVECVVWNGALLQEMEDWPRLAEFADDEVPRHVLAADDDEPTEAGEPEPDGDDSDPLPF